MALITTQDDGIEYGIRQPVLTHKWGVFFPSLPDDASEMLRLQAVECKLNLALKTFEIRIEQPEGVSGILTSISLLALHGGDIEVEIGRASCRERV